MQITNMSAVHEQEHVMKSSVGSRQDEKLQQTMNLTVKRLEQYMQVYCLVFR